MTGITRTRITGMVSGLDTDAIVQASLLKSKEAIDKIERERKDTALKMEKLQDVNKMIADFKNTYLSTLSAKSLSSLSTFKAFNIERTGDISAAAATATTSATGNAVTLDKVSQLATAASVKGSKVAWDSDYINTSSALSDIMFDSSLDTSDSDGKVSFKINGITFSMNDDVTVDEVINAINNSKAGVTMKYDKTTDSFSLTSKTTGANSEIVIENISGNLFGTAVETGEYDDDGNEIIESLGGAFGIAEGTYGGGKNAIYTIDGVERESETNTFTEEGISITLKKVSDKSLTFEVSTDVDKTVEVVKEFVNAYNKLLEDLQGLLNEKYHKDYRSMTDEERSTMAESTAKLWDEKTKSGMLRNDRDISTFVNTIRTTMVGAISSGGTGGLTLSQMGIKSASYKDAGKLGIDETKLREIISSNPEGVADLFRGTNGAGGLVTKLSDAVSNLTSKITSVITKSVEKDVEFEKQYNAKVTKYNDEETALYNKYARMEELLAQLNSSGISNLFS